MKFSMFYIIFLVIVYSFTIVNCCFTQTRKPIITEISIRNACPVGFFSSKAMLSEESNLLKLSSIMCLDTFNVMLYVENGIYNSIEGFCVLETILTSSNTYINETKHDIYMSEKRFKMIVFLDAARKYFSTKTTLCSRGSGHSFIYDKFVFDQYDILDSILTLKIYLCIESLATDKTTVRVRLRYFST